MADDEDDSDTIVVDAVQPSHHHVDSDMSELPPSTGSTASGTATEPEDVTMQPQATTSGTATEPKDMTMQSQAVAVMPLHDTDMEDLPDYEDFLMDTENEHPLALASLMTEEDTAMTEEHIPGRSYPLYTGQVWTTDSRAQSTPIVVDVDAFLPPHAAINEPDLSLPPSSVPASAVAYVVDAVAAPSVESRALAGPLTSTAMNRSRSRAGSASNNGSHQAPDSVGRASNAETLADASTSTMTPSPTQDSNTDTTLGATPLLSSYVMKDKTLASTPGAGSSTQAMSTPPTYRTASAFPDDDDDDASDGESESEAEEAEQEETAAQEAEEEDSQDDNAEEEDFPQAPHVTEEELAAHEQQAETLLDNLFAQFAADDAFANVFGNTNLAGS